MCKKSFWVTAFLKTFSSILLQNNNKNLSDDLQWFYSILLQEKILLYVMMYILFLHNKCLQKKVQKVFK